MKGEDGTVSCVDVGGRRSARDNWSELVVGGVGFESG